MKTCYFCKGPIVNRRLDYMANKKGQYVLVRRLLVESCRQCGEVYLDASASSMIDKALREIERTHEHMAVPIVSLA